MKNSKTAIKELMARYRTILCKCLLLNLVIVVGLIKTSSAMASASGMEFDSDRTLDPEWYLDVTQDYEMNKENTEKGMFQSIFVKDNATFSITDALHIMPTNFIVEEANVNVLNKSNLDTFTSDIEKTKLTLNDSELSASNLDLAKSTVDILSGARLLSKYRFVVTDSILNLSSENGMKISSMESTKKLIELDNTKITFNNGGEIRLDDGTYGGQLINYDDFENDEALIARFGGYDDPDDSYLTAYTAYDKYSNWVEETRTVYEYGKLDVNGGEINIIKGIEVFDFPKDDETFSAKANVIMAKDIALSNKAQLNVQEGATLFTFQNNNKGLSFGNATINLDSTSVVNLAGAVHGDIEGNGTLNINHSKAMIDGNVNGVDININSNTQLVNTFKGSLKGSKTTITSGNTLDIGSKTFITDSFVVEDNSALAFRVSGKKEGTFGTIKADSIEISQNGTNLNLTLDNGILEKDETKTFKILNTENLNGAFANLSQNARYEFKDNKDGTFDITGKATVADVVVEAGGNINDVKVANAWLNNNTIKEGTKAHVVVEHLNDLSQENLQKFKQALQALPPDTAPIPQLTAGAINNQITNAINNRLNASSLVNHARMGRSGGDIYLNSTGWVQGLYNKSKLDTENGFDGDTKGVAMGIDGEIAKDFRVGVGYAYTTSTIDSLYHTTDINTHTGIAYAQYDYGNAFVNGVMTYSFNKNEEQKNIGDMTVDADYYSHAVFGQVLAGYHTKVKNINLTPELGLRHLWAKTQSYTDSAEQHIKGDATNTLTGVIGLRGDALTKLKGVTDVVFRPEVKVAATYDVINDKGHSVVRLANGSSYAVQGDAMKRLGIEAGVGVNAQVGSSEVGLNYEGRFRKDYTDHTGLINFKQRF